MYRQKINFISHAFLEILERYANLFWVLWVCLVAHTQNDSINLQKTLMFIFMPKIHFNITRLTNTRDFEFYQIWDWWCNINNNISFYFRLFPRKPRDKFFKVSKKHILGDILGPFCPNLSEMKFPGKKSSGSF